MNAPFTPAPGCVGATILTHSGVYFDFLSPETSPIYPADIAHALANVCRYAGHTRTFYSVAQHCWIASHLVPEEDAFAALMHDASEAFTGDMSAPLKQLLPEFKAIEHRIEQAIADRFDVPFPYPATVKRADHILLKTEKRDLTSGRDHEWPGLDYVDAMESVIVPWPPAEAEARWLDRFTELSGARSC